MSRSRDIAKILGATEANNTSNVRLFQSDEEVGLDSGQVQNVGLQKFTSLDSLPSTGLTSGQQAWVESSGRLYISNGSGWYNVALVNASPTLTLDQSGTILMGNNDPLTITVTATATDSDDNLNIITFSVESDGNMVGTGTTLSQDSSVFTITALSEDSGGTAGDFTLTFKATDQIAVDNESLSFSLSFSNVVDSSAQTILLLKALDSDATNGSITFLDSDGSAGVGYNENGDPQATTFTPYRSGGYSTYFDGSGDYISFADNAALEFGSGDFTMEAWVYPEAIDTSFSVIVNRWDSTSLKSYIVALTSSAVYFYYSTTGSNQTLLSWTETVPLNEWTHLAIVRNGDDLDLYVNGTAHSTTNSMSGVTLYGGTSVTKVGILGDLNAGTDFTGYIRDLRLIKGTAQYTSDFTAPTGSLTAVSGTSLLTCHLPYIADGSTNDHSPTITGNTRPLPFGPYDYEPWVGNDHGGSVHFDGNDSLKVDGSPTWPNFGTGAFTVECWVYQPTLAIASLVTVHRQAVSSGWYLSIGNTSGNPNWGSYGNGDNADNTSTGAIKAGAWNHIAMVRTSTSTNGSAWYINGKAAGTFTDTSDYASYTYGPWIGSNDTGGGNARYFIGNIADIRVSNSAVYSAEFTPPTAPLTATANTVHLMNNKSDANVYDLAAANTLSLYQNTKSSTAQRKFTTSSALVFDGAADAIEISPGYDNPIYDFGTEDWTIEGWIYSTNLTSNHTVFSFIKANTSPTYNTPYVYTSGTAIKYWAGGIDRITGTAALTLNTWHHIAVTRSGNDHKLFCDGTQVGSTWTNAFTYVQGRPSIGDFYTTVDTLSDGSEFAGYVQDYRVTKGYARYTAAFTPPTAEFEL